MIVLPEYQHEHLGEIIVRLLLKKVPGCNTILLATPEQESFYAKLFGTQSTTFSRNRPMPPS